MRLPTKEELLDSFNHLIPIYNYRIGQFIPSDRKATILDCPCGYGNIYYYLRKSGYTNVDAIDIDRNKIDVAHSIGLTELSTGDAFEVLKKSENHYQVIISVDFLEHIEKKKVYLFLSLCRKSLQENGLLLLRMPCAESPFHGVAVENDFTHQWSATSGVIRDILTVNGFKGVEIFADSPVPYKLINRIRRLTYEATSRLIRTFGSFCGFGSPHILTPNMWVVARKYGENK